MKVYYGFSVRLDSGSVSHAKEMAEFLYSAEDRACRRIKIRIMFFESSEKVSVLYEKHGQTGRGFRLPGV